MSEKENELEVGQISSEGGEGTDSGDSVDGDGGGDNSLALVLAASAAPAEDPHVALNPTAAVFVVPSKLCPVTYSFHPYTKMSNSGNNAIHGLGRPALTLQSTVHTQPKGGAGIPRVYQSESRNIFVAEYEKFKETKMNLQKTFPASMISAVNFDEWVDFRAEFTEDRVKELNSKIENRENEARARRNVFSQSPVPNYDVDPSRFPKPVIPFPRTTVGGQPPPVIKKANDIYFENWSKIGHLWGKDTEPMPRAYPYSYGQESIWGPPTMSPARTNPRTPKLVPVDAMRGAATTRPEPTPPIPHAPDGAAIIPGTGEASTPTSKAPEYPGFQGGMPVPVTAFPGMPQSNGGYVNNHYVGSQPGGGYQQNPGPNPGIWKNYNSVPPPNFAGGQYVGNQFGGGYYGPGPMPQSGSQNVGAYNNGYYGHNFNPQGPGFAPGAQNVNFVPGSGPSVNFQQPGYAPGAQNAKFAQYGGHNNSFQQPGFAPGAQNANPAQNGVYNPNLQWPVFAPGVQKADPTMNGGHNNGFQQPGFAPGAQNVNFVPGSGPSVNFQQPTFAPGAQNANFVPSGGPSMNFQQPGYAPGAQNANFVPSGGPSVNFQQPGYAPGAQNANFVPSGGPSVNFHQPGYAPGAQNTNFTQSGGHNNSFQQPGFAPGAQNANFVPSGGPSVNFQQPGFAPGAQNTNFTQNGDHNRSFQQPEFTPDAQNGIFAQDGGPLHGYVPVSTGAPVPVPTSSGRTNGSAGAFQNGPQQHPITGYAFESDDDYVPEDYEHEGYNNGELVGEGEGFDSYDPPSTSYRDVSDVISELSLGDTKEREEKKAEPMTGAQPGEENGVNQNKTD